MKSSVGAGRRKNLCFNNVASAVGIQELPQRVSEIVVMQQVRYLELDSPEFYSCEN